MQEITFIIRSTLLAIFLFVTVTSCSTTRFYGQAIAGQFEITRKAEPVTELLSDPATPSQLAKKLALSQEIIAFARDEMHLDPKKSYRKYADLDRPHVVWNVFATPEFSTAPIRWRYPLVGKLSYKGYFSEDDALAEASRLREQDNDAFVGGVDAYSTLGWLADPLLNTFIDRSEPSLVALLCHELAHAKYYRSSDSSFSEAFAVTVEEEAVKRWYLQKGKSPPAYSAHRQRSIEFLLNARRQLQDEYTASENLPINERRIRKADLITKITSEYRTLKSQIPTSTTIDQWFKDGLTNAHLSSISTYYEKVPEFRKLLQEHHNDLPSFYKAVANLPANQ